MVIVCHGSKSRSISRKHMSIEVDCVTPRDGVGPLPRFSFNDDGPNIANLETIYPRPAYKPEQKSP